MRTHASYDGYLRRLVRVIDLMGELPEGSRFIAYGRLVYPTGNYADSPRIAIYETPEGLMART